MNVFSCVYVYYEKVKFLGFATVISSLHKDSFRGWFSHNCHEHIQRWFCRLQNVIFHALFEDDKNNTEDDHRSFERNVQGNRLHGGEPTTASKPWNHSSWSIKIFIRSLLYVHLKNISEKVVLPWPWFFLHFSDNKYIYSVENIHYKEVRFPGFGAVIVSPS